MRLERFVAALSVSTLLSLVEELRCCRRRNGLEMACRLLEVDCEQMSKLCFRTKEKVEKDSDTEARTRRTITVANVDLIIVMI